MKAELIDRLVCGWSMDFNIALSEEALNELVDRIRMASIEEEDIAQDDEE